MESIVNQSPNGFILDSFSDDAVELSRLDAIRHSSCEGLGMKTMELEAKGVESSGALIVQGEDLLVKLAQVDRGRRLLLRAEGLPSGFELSLIVPLTG